MGFFSEMSQKTFDINTFLRHEKPELNALKSPVCTASPNANRKKVAGSLKILIFKWNEAENKPVSEMNWPHIYQGKIGNHLAVWTLHESVTNNRKP